MSADQLKTMNSMFSEIEERLQSLDKDPSNLVETKQVLPAEGRKAEDRNDRGEKSKECSVDEVEAKIASCAAQMGKETAAGKAEAACTVAELKHELREVKHLLHSMGEHLDMDDRTYDRNRDHGAWRCGLELNGVKSAELASCVVM